MTQGVLAAWQVFIGEIARPLAVLATSFAAAIATVEIAQRVENGTDGALFIGAVFTGLAVIYGAKSVEVFKKAQVAGEVEKARGPAPHAGEPEADPTAFGGPRI